MRTKKIKFNLGELSVITKLIILHEAYSELVKAAEFLKIQLEDVHRLMESYFSNPKLFKKFEKMVGDFGEEIAKVIAEQLNKAKAAEDRIALLISILLNYKAVIIGVGDSIALAIVQEMQKLGGVEKQQ